MESLSDELMMDILSRVPTFELGNLRCVCKRWRDIVKVRDPLFRTLHSMSRPTGNDNLLLLKGLDDDLCFLDLAASRGGELVSVKTIKTPYVDVPSFLHYDIIGSCNGLLCLGSKKRREILVMNPFTNQHMRWDMNISGRCFTWGFGFDSVKKRYKVVVVEADWDMCNWETEKLKICDLDSECSSNWRDIQLENLSSLGMEPLCFVNGRLHWICYSDIDLRIITSFDLADEEIRLIRSPPFNSLQITRTFNLFVLRDCLCIIRSHRSQTPSLEIWVMKEYGVESSWVKEVHMEAFIPKSLIRGLGSIRDGQVLLKCKRKRLQEAVLFSIDTTCSQFHFLEYEGAPFFKESIIHTASLNWI